MNSKHLLALAFALLLAPTVVHAQGGDPLLRDPEKKGGKFDSSKVTYLTAWPKPQKKEQITTDLDRVVKASIPEMAEGGHQGLVAEGTAAVPFVLERYGREKDDEVLARLKAVLMEITKPEQTRLLAQDFAHKDVLHRTFALWRCAAWPDAQIKPLAEAAWAKVVKQGEKADADERYAAALCTTASGSLAAFDAVFEIAQKSWAKKGGELRIALEAVRGPGADEDVARAPRRRAQGEDRGAQDARGLRRQVRGRPAEAAARRHGQRDPRRDDQRAPRRRRRRQPARPALRVRVDRDGEEVEGAQLTRGPEPER